MAKILSEQTVISTAESGPLFILTQEVEVPDDMSTPGTYEARVVDVRMEDIPLVWEGDYA